MDQKRKREPIDLDIERLKQPTESLICSFHGQSCALKSTSFNNDTCFALLPTPTTEMFSLIVNFNCQ
jgi:hypothetical protein